MKKSAAKNHSFPIVLVIAFAALWPALAGADDHQEIEKHLRHAQSYYWAGIVENGSHSAFTMGLQYAEKTEDLLNRLNLAPEEKAAYRVRLEALRQDLTYQQEMAHDTLKGVFPLTYIMRHSLFNDFSVGSTYEVFDEPDVIALSAAVEKTVQHLSAKYVNNSQLRIRITSSPPSPALENEARYILNTNPNFFAGPDHESISLRGGRQDEMQNVDLQLIRFDETPEGMVVYKVVTVVEGIGGDSSRFVAFGVSRDRRDTLFQIIVFIAAGFVLSAIFFFLTSLDDERPPNVVLLSSFNVFGYVLGFIVSWTVAGFMASMLPPPETMAVIAFWWPMSAGIVLIVLPAVLLRMFAPRIRALFGLAAEALNHESIYISILIGVSIYHTVPMLILGGSEGIPLAILVVLSFICMGIGTERIIGGKSSRLAIVPLLLLVVTFGLAYFSAQLIPILLYFTASLAAVALALTAFRNRKPSEVAEENSTLNAADCRKNEELALLARNPPFFEQTDTFASALDAVRPFTGEHKTKWLLLQGEPGTGKTEMARALLRSIRELIPRVLVLEGHCSLAQQRQNSPFEVFNQVLSPFKYRLNADNAAIQNVTDSLGGIMDFIPIASFITPPADDTLSTAGSKEDTFASMKGFLTNLPARKGRPTIVFIDDIHWLDEASQELIHYLNKELPSGSDYALLFVLTMRNKQPLEHPITAECISVTALTIDERSEYLNKYFNLEAGSARAIAEWSDLKDTDYGEMLWLFEIIRSLAKEELFTLEDGRFSIPDSYISGEKKLPMPEHLNEIIAEQLNQLGENRPLLECAACMGKRFEADIVASVLEEEIGLSTLGVIRRFNDIAATTGFISDDDESGMFAFKNNFILETIRGIFKISLAGPGTSGAPQLIRAYHYEIASRYAEDEDYRRSKLFQIVNHYYASGKRGADEAISWALKAARSARKTFSYRQARQYLAKAEECAESIGISIDLETPSFLIDLEEAYVDYNKEKLIPLAERAARLLDESDNISHELYIAMQTILVPAFKESQGESRKIFKDSIHKIISEFETWTSSKAYAKGHAALLRSHICDTAEEAAKLLKTGISETGEPGTIEEKRVLSRLNDSLGQKLGIIAQDDDERREGIEAYLNSIELKSSPELNDTLGLAISHSGAAALYLELTSPATKTAREHAVKGAGYFKNLHSIPGLSKCHSLIGKSWLMESASHTPGTREFTEALNKGFEHYKDSWDMAQPGSLNRIFAAAGLLQCFSENHSQAVIQEIRQEFQSHAANGNSYSRGMLNIEAAAAVYKERTGDESLDELATRLQRD